MAMMLQMLTF